jgi:hypothetical protein
VAPLGLVLPHLSPFRCRVGLARLTDRAQCGGVRQVEDVRLHVSPEDCYVLIPLVTAESRLASTLPLK